MDRRQRTSNVWFGLLLLLLGNLVITTVTAISLLGNNNNIAGTSTALPKVGLVSAGPLQISQLGCGTWSWGNRLLWDYDKSQDEEIYEAYSQSELPE